VIGFEGVNDGDLVVGETVGFFDGTEAEEVRPTNTTAIIKKL